MKDNPSSSTKSLLEDLIAWVQQYNADDGKCVPLMNSIAALYQNANDPMNRCHLM